MSHGVTTNTGAGSFDGPLMLSGLALAKGALLQMMENYTNFMCSMYELVGENASSYAETVQSQAGAEKDQMLEQNNADLSSGLAEGFASIGAAAFTFGKEAYSNRDHTKELAKLEKQKTNLTQVHSDLLETAEKPTNPTKPYTRTVVGQSARGGAPSVTTRDEALIAKDEALVKKVASSHQDTIDELSAEGDSKGLKKDVKDAINRLQWDADQAKAAGAETPAHAANRKLVTKATDTIKERIRHIENKETELNQKKAMVRQDAQVWGEVTKGSIQLSGGGARFSFANQSADDRAKATITGSGAQVLRDAGQSLDKTASEAAQQAEGYIRMLKELQANNTSRA